MSERRTAAEWREYKQKRVRLDLSEQDLLLDAYESAESALAALRLRLEELTKLWEAETLTMGGIYAARALRTILHPEGAKGGDT